MTGCCGAAGAGDLVADCGRGGGTGRVIAGGIGCVGAGAGSVSLVATDCGCGEDDSVTGEATGCGGEDTG